MRLLKKIKNNLSAKIMQKKTARNSKQETKNAKAALKEARPELKKDIPGVQELIIERAKFSHPEPQRKPRFMPSELPYRYGRDKIVAQVRDPWWIHVYWELNDSTLERFKNELADEFHQARRVLRVYDISSTIFNGENAHSFFDIEIGEQANNWYIDTANPGRSWCIDYGLKLTDGRFITVLRSNTVHTPLDAPSCISDEEWMIPEEMFARLYGMSFGFGKSSPLGKAWQERMRRELFSGVLASPGMASMASPVKKEKQRKFFFSLDCELIVYGATEPDAKVTVQEREIRLRPDGTFSLRFALPDGKQSIAVRAVSADKEEARSITPNIIRETKNA